MVVPTAVDVEIRRLRSLGKDISAYESAEWISVSSPANQQKINSLRINLDEGEAQAIALALEINCDLLLMDERIGTRIARSEGLQTLGLVGVLIKAKQEGAVSEVRPILTELKNRAGFWLEAGFEKSILTQIGEL